MTLTLLQDLQKASRHLSSVVALTAVCGLGRCLVGAAPALAERRDTKDDTTYTVKRIYKAGEIDRYQVTAKVNVDGSSGSRGVVMVMRIKDSTTEAKADGTATSLSEFEGATLTSAGTDLNLTALMPKLITTHDKNGKSDVKTEGGQEEVIAQLGDQIKQFTLSAAAVYLPPKPIKVGETWDMNSVSGAEKEPKIKGKVTLLSVDMVNGVTVGKFKTVSNITGSKDIKLHTEATTLMDMTTGKPLNFTSKSEGTSAEGKVNVEMELKMLGPDDKGDNKAPAKSDSDVKKP